ncbi:superoxide dismutase [Candidatus Woesebacteria bacterium]|nr:MAG: superoxide dismutase [Candidatus Woesebacteria bacterium]
MIFELPQLRYSYAALEPYIDALTMEIHYTKHHASYVSNLNKALEGVTNLEKLTVEELLMQVEKVPDNIRQTVINNAGGHANHSMFWQTLCPGGVDPKGEVKKILTSTFGSFDKFKEEFTAKALSLFGSGWVFLVMGEDRKLYIKRHSFQNSPYLYRHVPLLGLDVWEHAYYLKYQNRRNDYVAVWWKIVNWDEVEFRFEAQGQNKL